jgi:hypothetical protein
MRSSSLFRISDILKVVETGPAGSYRRGNHLNPDFAFECTHKHSNEIQVALSIKLIVVMELFY